MFVATRYCFGLVISRISLLFLYFIVFSAFVIKIVMNTYHAAFWSDPYSSSDEEEEICRYRNTHEQRTKWRGNGQQQQRPKTQDSWTWEEILDGRGPWAQSGEYRRPNAELEAAKAERHWYEEAARRRGWKPESQPQKIIGGSHRECVEAR